jgi:galactokinase/mevalonate kinase-like predicted kinase
MSGARGTAYARAALLGNPSDGYGGRTISFAFTNLSADVEVVEAERSEVHPAAGRPLLQATLARFRRYARAAEQPVPASGLSFHWRTSIPREVGLGGSSAIVIAAIRALCGLYGVSIPRGDLPTMALSVETEGLGIEAGLQDRVAQTYEGLTYMDFEPEAVPAQGHGAYEQLDPGLLPPLLVAYEPGASESSSRPHGDLRGRYERGDPDVVQAMDEIAGLARLGRDCLLSGDHDGLRRALDRNFDARRRLYPLDPRHIRMIEAARSAGASANYAGSGGAITAIPGEGDGLEPVRSALENDGCEVIVPQVPR